MKSYINPLACRVAALFTLMMIICPLSIGAQIEDKGGSGWYFTRENNVTKLHHYSGEVTENVTTPATVYYQGVGYPVTAIGENVFRSNMLTTLKKVTISEGVTSIEASAFRSCTALVSASLPSSLRSIGEMAFDGCSSLASIAIPDGVGVIPDAAFTDCTSLANVTIPASVTTIDNSAFSGCSALKSITIPNSVTAIGEYAFKYSGLTIVYFAGTWDEWKAVSIGGWSFECNGGHHGNYLEDIDFFHWRCTLTFDVQGHGTAPAPQTLWSNIDATTRPADPEATGYTFGGWYRGPAGTGDPFKFGDILLDNYTCYAKWTPLPNTISFYLGDKGTSIPDQTVYSGNRVSEPAVQFVGTAGSEEGIEGWYTDENLTEPYNFEAEVDHSFTLYAKWAEAGHYTLTATEGGTATLTDAKGRAYANGPIMPGTYTLTVAPQDGYSFTGSYTLIKRSDGSGESAQTLKGNTTTTRTLDLTTKDADITVTFSTNPIVSVIVSTDGTAEAGTYTMQDGHNNVYVNGSTVTPVGESASPSDDIKLTVTKGETVGCALTIVNNGQKTQRTDDTSSYAFAPQGNVTIELFFYDKTSGMMTLLDDDSAQGEGQKNADLLSAANGLKRMVTLSGRTLYRDGNWNTLCLPFDVDIVPGSALNKTGMTLMELDTEAGSYTNATGFDDGTLYLNFRDAGTTIHAGKPYIIKWKSSNSNISEPVFGPVTITTGISAVESTDGTLSFTGLYSPVNIAGEDRSILFLGEDNNLYYPNAATTIKPFRAYFKLGDGASNVSSMRLGFGDGSATAVRLPLMENGEGEMENDADAWYDLAGRRLTDRPATPGIYIHSGKKIVIK